jgi:hypothetical protein
MEICKNLNQKIMRKQLLLFCLFAINVLIAQVPSYVPNNGLVGYWPFNGNANDESGNGNNGTVNGATLTSDRLGAPNSAYNFNGDEQYIQAPNQSLQGSVSFSGWYKMPSYNLSQADVFFFANNSPSNSILDCNFATGYRHDAGTGQHGHSTYPRSNSNLTGYYALNQIPSANVWHHFVCVFENGVSVKMYLDNNLFYTNNNVISNASLLSLPMLIGFAGQGYSFTGQLDNIGIWNRALSQEEITGLYTTLGTEQTPANNQITIYPNPTKEQITIDCGTLSNASGWSYKIVNTLGQEVLNGEINSQQNLVSLNSLNGTGVYFVKIYDTSNNLLNTKKIILQ